MPGRIVTSELKINNKKKRYIENKNPGCFFLYSWLKTKTYMTIEKMPLRHLDNPTHWYAQITNYGAFHFLSFN